MVVVFKKDIEKEFVMKEVTKNLIRDFRIYQLGFDFMGYKVDRNTSVDFHHFLVPKRDCVRLGFGEGYTYDNGVILAHNSSHPYLHQIEIVDYTRFADITSEMNDMKIKGYLDMENICAIDDILRDFEREYHNVRTKKGHVLIKPEYRQRVLTKL